MLVSPEPVRQLHICFVCGCIRWPQSPLEPPPVFLVWRITQLLAGNVFMTVERLHHFRELQLSGENPGVTGLGIERMRIRTAWI